MRAPFQILALPYKFAGGELLFGVFYRSDHDQWQFVSGGGEDDETPIVAAKREIFEECGLEIDEILPLKSLCFVPVENFSEKFRENWADDTYVIPEYSFGFECCSDIVLSHEHTEFCWLTYDEAYATLKWDSNRTAMYELRCRLNENNKKSKL